MRAVFSVLALLLVVFVVMKLAGTQLGALKPDAGTAAAGGANPAETAATPAGLAQDRAGRVVEAMQQGAAGRASEASR